MGTGISGLAGQEDTWNNSLFSSVDCNLSKARTHPCTLKATEVPRVKAWGANSDTSTCRPAPRHRLPEATSHS